MTHNIRLFNKYILNSITEAGRQPVNNYELRGVTIVYIDEMTRRYLKALYTN